MKSFIYQVFIVFITGILLASCSSTRKIPEGDALYTGASIRMSSDTLSKKKQKSLKGDLSSLLRPKPNKKFLGMRFKLSMYNLAGKPKKESSPAGWLKYKVGEPPVLLSSLNLDQNIKVLQSTLENQGFFQAVVTGDTVVKKKKASAVYTVNTGPLYTIREVVFVKDSSEVSRHIDTASKNTSLRSGQPFDLDVIKDERERIDAFLKERGFYFFDADYLIIQTDSTVGHHQVNLYVRIKPVTPPQAKQIYRINDIFIFPGYRLNSPTGDTLKQNASYYKGYYVVDRRKMYKPRLFDEAMKFSPGDVYNRTDHNMSINRLVNLGVFKFVKNRFEVVEGKDSAQLNSYYYLTAFPKKSIRAEINANTKSNNLTGSSITLGWRNRNTFRGGELFSIDATGGFEVQFSGRLKGFNTYRAGIEAGLAFPRFLVPILDINTNSSYLPRTNIKLGYDILTKQKLYTMNSVRAEFGYNWKESIEKEHQLNPIAINSVQPMWISKLYEDSAANNPTLQKAVEKQFILGSSYNFNYNELQGDKRDGLYFNGNVDLSGNIAGLITGANAARNDPKFILGGQFSQYVKLESDLRYYLTLEKNIIWANRLIVGVGYPWGNSQALPFIKQFFVGGTNSIRAFRSRSLGPGTYIDTTSTTFLPDQSGDVKLEFNTELRAKLFGIVHGALFMDVGNIWLYNKDSIKTGAAFTNKFIRELAVGVGAGLRFDISFLVLRLDLAMPLRKPWLPDGQRWVTKNIRFSSASWRRENLVFNLGIGYPF